MHGRTAFDAHARRYDESLDLGLQVSGENRDYFAEGRIRFLSHCLRHAGVDVRRVLDYGCGDGRGTNLLLSGLRAESAIGVDESGESIDLARARQATGPGFETLARFKPDGNMDLVYCNGVFHHIPPGERPAALGTIRAALRPEGILAFWENNPWNPGTRLVMKRIPFDRDAIPLSAPTARRLLRAEGFDVLRTDFLFIFPRQLKWLRVLEWPLSRAPLGAQYQVLARRSAAHPDARRTVAGGALTGR